MTRYFLAALLLTVLSPLHSKAEASSRIEGVADFLMERANSTTASMFEKKINSNPLIKDYFPNTSNILKSFDLKTLMLNDGLWKDNVEKDLGNFTDVLKNQIKDEVAATLRGYTSDLEMLSVGSTQITELKKLIEENKAAITADPLKDPESIELAILFLNDIAIKTSQLAIVSSSNTLASLRSSLEYMSYIYDVNRSYTERVSYAIMLAEKLNIADKISHNRPKIYKCFKDYILFFAQLSDSKSKTDAKLVLQTFALPQDSYIGKRNNDMRFSISSYLGIAGGVETYSSSSFFYNGLFAPIGLEASWGTKQKGSISILGTVLDLGAVINSQIYDSSESFDLHNIYSPGIGLIYGLPNIPLSVGAGYFRVNSVKDDSMIENRVLVFVALDMPLFSLY